MYILIRDYYPILKKQIQKAKQMIREIQPDGYDPFLSREDWRSLGILSLIVIILLQIINIVL